MGVLPSLPRTMCANKAPTDQLALIAFLVWMLLYFPQQQDTFVRWPLKHEIKTHRHNQAVVALKKSFCCRFLRFFVYM